MGKYIDLTKDNFDSEIAEGVTMVDFWAEWCGPCRALGPIIDELANDFEGKAKICKVNIDNENQIAAKYGIKSILNMRNLGTAKGKDWYVFEKTTAKDRGIAHYDYPIFNREEASLTQMNEIVEIIKNAPKPLLIHCKAGADRTSLASALYLHAVKSDVDAEKQLSILYGHFPWLASKTGAMDRSFKRYQAATKLSQLQF